MTPDANHKDTYPFDYSTPEAQDALKGLSGPVLGVRDDYSVTLEPGIVRTADQSTPAGRDAVKGLSGLVLEIRAEYVQARRQVTADSERKVAFYERTLGLGVVPVLVRRAAYSLMWKIRGRGQGGS